MQDVYDENVTLILTPDMRGAIQIFCSQEAEFEGVTPQMLCYLAQPILDSLLEKYDDAEIVGVNYSDMTISGHTHGMIVYNVTKGDFSASMDLYGYVSPHNWLCEVDIFAPADDTDLRRLLNAMMAETLTYLVD